VLSGQTQTQTVNLWSTPVQLMGVDTSTQPDLSTVEYESARANSVSRNTQILEQPEWHGLREQALHTINHYAYAQLSITCAWQITNSWIARTLPGESHHTHDHPNSILSGVIYLRTEPSEIHFHGQPGALAGARLDYPVHHRTETNSTTWVQPVEQDISIVFPSHVQHSVPTNTSNTTRIILGYNAWPRGNFYTDYAGDLRL